MADQSTIGVTLTRNDDGSLGITMQQISGGGWGVEEMFALIYDKAADEIESVKIGGVPIALDEYEDDDGMTS